MSKINVNAEKLYAEVKFWNEDFTECKEKIVDEDELGVLLEDAKLKAESVPKQGRRCQVWYGNMTAVSRYGQTSSLMPMVYEFFAQPKLETKSNLIDEYYAGPVTRKMMVANAVC